MKNFIKKAIKNGYDNNCCNGWEWIENNLKDLDFIFQSEEYKSCKGYKSKCMPIILRGEELNELETRVLETAWYLENKRVHKQENEEKIKKFNEKGFFNIDDDEKLDKKKIEFLIHNPDEMFGGIQKHIGKLSWSKIDKRLMCLPRKNRRRGHWNAKNVFVKFLEITIPLRKTMNIKFKDEDIIYSVNVESPTIKKGKLKGYELCHTSGGQIFPRAGWYIQKTKNDTIKDIRYVEVF